MALYRKAAERGGADSQLLLATCYLKGVGVEQNIVVAAEWALRAAAQGYADAQSNMGVLCERGQGVPRSLAQAEAWYRRAGAYTRSLQSST